MPELIEQPTIVLPARTVRHVLRLMVRNWRPWAALAVILMLVSIVPAAARVPVAIALSVVLLAPTMARIKDPITRIPADAPCWRDLTKDVQFFALVQDAGSSPNRWHQARCAVHGSDLLITPSSRWRGAEPQRLNLRASTIRSLSVGNPREGLKANVHRVIDLNFPATGGLLMAVDHTQAAQVKAVLESRQ